MLGRLSCDGARGARTPDLRRATAALSQLSYGPQSVRLGECNAGVLIRTSDGTVETINRAARAAA